MNIEKAVHWHKIVVVKSKGLFGNEPVHTNVHIIHGGGNVKYGEFDIKETSEVIPINPKVKFPYLTCAVKKIINGEENIAIGNSGMSSYFFDAGKYDILVEAIKSNRERLNNIKDFLDAEQFESCSQ